MKRKILNLALAVLILFSVIALSSMSTTAAAKQTEKTYVRDCSQPGPCIVYVYEDGVLTTVYYE